MIILIKEKWDFFFLLRKLINCINWKIEFKNEKNENRIYFFL